jgi:hypothetical protein
MLPALGITWGFFLRILWGMSNNFKTPPVALLPAHTGGIHARVGALAVAKCVCVRSPLAEYLLQFEGITKLDDLPIDARQFFEYLVLVIDIESQRRYGEGLAEQYGRGYNKNVIDEAPTGQLPPSEQGLSGYVGGS